jgi:hypothetical protein
VAGPPGIGCCLRTGTRGRPQTTPVSLTAPSLAAYTRAWSPK